MARVPLLVFLAFLFGEAGGCEVHHAVVDGDRSAEREEYGEDLDGEGRGSQVPGEDAQVLVDGRAYAVGLRGETADVVHDRKHRSALMWVERFTVPATAPDQVHFLLWIVARINEILPVTWARFDSVDDAVKSRAAGGGNHGGEEPFILAGNPLADRFRRHGEETALAWAVGQSVWSRRELAGMLI